MYARRSDDSDDVSFLCSRIRRGHPPVRKNGGQIDLVRYGVRKTAADRDEV